MNNHEIEIQVSSRHGGQRPYQTIHINVTGDTLQDALDCAVRAARAAVAPPIGTITISKGDALKAYFPAYEPVHAEDCEEKDGHVGTCVDAAALREEERSQANGSEHDPACPSPKSGHSGLTCKEEHDSACEWERFGQPHQCVWGPE